jgi:invasion protein IalB
MFKTMIAAASLTIFAVAAPSAATAAEENPPAAAPAKAEDEGKNKVVCRRVEAIGTRLSSKRVCRTKGEWDAEQAADRQALERSQTQRYRD